jgi:hypothetical protein
MSNPSPYGTPQSILQAVDPTSTLHLEKDNPGAQYGHLIEILYNLTAQVTALTTQYNALQASYADLQTKFNNHVHSGVTAGAANSGATTTTSTVTNGNAVNQQLRTL